MTALTRAAQGEGVTLDATVAELIARSAEGSFRDALGLLDRVLSHSGGGAVTMSLIDDALGLPQRTVLEGIVLALAQKDSAAALTLVHEAHQRGVRGGMLLRALIAYFRNVLLAKYGGATALARFSADEQASLTTVLKHKSTTISSASLAKLLRALPYERVSDIDMLPLELAIMEIVEQA